MRLILDFSKIHLLFLAAKFVVTLQEEQGMDTGKKQFPLSRGQQQDQGLSPQGWLHGRMAGGQKASLG